MRYTRKLLLLSVMALTAIALAATTASAQGVIVLEEEAPDVTHECAELVPPVGMYGQVTGGCHVNFTSGTGGDIPLIVHVPGVGELVQFNCELGLETRLDGNGEGYVTEFDFQAPHGAGSCTRLPCDNPVGETEPWPFHITEDGAGEEDLEMTFCLRTAASGPGGAPSFCEIHVPLHDLGGHQYEVELDSALCEVNPPGVTVELAGHLLSDPTVEGEQIEIIH